MEGSFVTTAELIDQTVAYKVGLKGLLFLEA